MIYSIYHEKRSIHNEAVIFQNPSVAFGPDYELLNVGPNYDTEKYTDNINHLNPFINELTGLYHIWKYCEDDIVGLSHYRRAFVRNGTNTFISLDDAKKVLESNEIICATRVNEVVSNITALRCQLRDDEHFVNKYFDILCEYEPGIRRYYEIGRVTNPKNMFICKKSIIDSYCEFLFPIIIPITEKFMKEDAKYCSNIRLLGFIFERIFTYWLKVFDLKYYECEYGELSRKVQ